MSSSKLRAVSPLFVIGLSSGVLTAFSLLPLLEDVVDPEVCSCLTSDVLRARGSTDTAPILAAGEAAAFAASGACLPGLLAGTVGA